jgi:putative ubiquitin-RnfH superfamily antitoxin RatB of RatAB toxin-antitoxin module
MADKTSLRCEVAYARPDRQWLVPVVLPQGATAMDALRSSRLTALCPEIDPERAVLGIFGQVVAADQRLRDGDRVEIYRPLAADPREARRERVKAARSKR